MGGSAVFGVAGRYGRFVVRCSCSPSARVRRRSGRPGTARRGTSTSTAGSGVGRTGQHDDRARRPCQPGRWRATATRSSRAPGRPGLDGGPHHGHTRSGPRRSVRRSPGECQRRRVVESACRCDRPGLDLDVSGLVQGRITRRGADGGAGHDQERRRGAPRGSVHRRTDRRVSGRPALDRLGDDRLPVRRQRLASGRDGRHLRSDTYTLQWTIDGASQTAVTSSGHLLDRQEPVVGRQHARQIQRMSDWDDVLLTIGDTQVGGR